MMMTQVIKWDMMLKLETKLIILLFYSSIAQR